MHTVSADAGGGGARLLRRVRVRPSDAVLEIRGRARPLDGRRLIETHDCGSLERDEGGGMKKN